MINLLKLPVNRWDSTEVKLSVMLMKMVFVPNSKEVITAEKTLFQFTTKNLNVVELNKNFLNVVEVMIHLHVIMNKILSFNVMEMVMLQETLSKKMMVKNLVPLNVVDYLYLLLSNFNVTLKEMILLSEETLVQFILLNVPMDVLNNPVIFGVQEFMLICHLFVKLVSMQELFKILVV